MSSLWAGPLAGQLLGQLGADVVKLEHPRRVDGARGGPADFFDLLNGGKACAALDPGLTDERRALLGLIASADVVIESARPRGLEQWGIHAAALVRAHPGLTWVSITGHGRAAPGEDWVAFGDDAAVAAGLVAWDGTGSPVFCADAVADPLTGLHATAAALATRRRGGGLVDVNLVGVARAVCDAAERTGFGEVPSDPVRTHAVGHPIRPPAARRPSRSFARPLSHPVAPPRARPVQQLAAAPGSDTRRVLERWCGTATATIDAPC